MQAFSLHIPSPQRNYLLVSAGLAMVMLACDPVLPQHDAGDDKVLAEVYDQKLTLRQVRPLLIDADTDEDSVSQVRNQVETWVRETLLLHEAAQNIPNDVNINKLVQDYRSSLLISTYENVLAKTLLDTVVTDAELRSYYDRNKQQFRVDIPLLRCHYVRLDKTLENRDQFEKLWRSTRPADIDAMKLFCQNYATEYLLEDSTWYRMPDIERLLPPGALNSQSLSTDRPFRFSDNEYLYYLKVIQQIPVKDIAPLSYVSDQAKRFILHKRKIELLEKIKADIYEREIKGDNVKIHI